MLVASIDVQTTGVTGPITIISTIYYNTVNNRSESFVFHSNEKELVSQFIDNIKEKNPDIIIGWYIINFDLKCIIDRCKKYGIQMFSPKNRTYGYPIVQLLDYYNGTFNSAIEESFGTFIDKNMDIKDYSLEISRLQYKLFMKLGIISQHRLISDLLNASEDDMLTIEI